jgi:DNA invertase Pin-like site-specific DNA recombinase
MQKYLGLARVSTAKQGEDGLGIGSGVDDINTYMRQNGGELIDILKEVESGKHKDIIDRPVLLKALAICKRRNAILLIPKIDRLTRSTELAADVKRSGVRFLACDMPQANEFTLDILVAVAAQERRAISDRTRKALETYRREKRVSKRIRALYPDGVPPEVVEATAGKLGAHLVGCKLTPEARARGNARSNARRHREAIDDYADLVPEILSMRQQGQSLRAIAHTLNLQGNTTRRNRDWSHVQVKRVLDRAQQKTPEHRAPG